MWIHGLPDRRLRVAIFLIAACVHIHWANGQNSTEIERQRIVAERVSAAQRLEDDKAVCYQKFVVTDCLNQAKARHDKNMAHLRQQDIALNNAQRTERAAEKLKSIDGKTAAALSPLPRDPRQKPMPTPSTRVPKMQDPAQKNAERSLQATRKAAQTAQKKAIAEQKAQQHRAKANQATAAQARYEKRQQDAALHKAEVTQRLREKKKSSAANLPVPL